MDRMRVVGLGRVHIRALAAGVSLIISSADLRQIRHVTERQRCAAIFTKYQVALVPSEFLVIFPAATKA